MSLSVFINCLQDEESHSQLSCKQLTKTFGLKHCVSECLLKVLLLLLNLQSVSVQRNFE